jgi:8-oxo-dGTP diphosphatase
MKVIQIQAQVKEKTNLKFIHEQEYWYISAFINKNPDILKMKDITEEIKGRLEKKLINLKEELEPIGDIPKGLDDYDKDEIKRITKKVIELGKNTSIIECKWVSHIEDFHYYDENIESEFHELGSFQFTIKYYNDSKSGEKEKLDPKHIQQIALIAKKELEEFYHSRDNLYFENESKSRRKILIDYESPIYIGIISNEIKSDENNIEWNKKTRENFKEILGRWTEIYSGDWPDYSEELFDSRIKNNLSNRTSELHYLHRNSGFIYMPKDNYEKCDDYVLDKLLTPTAKIRAISFALLRISESINILSDIQQEDSVKNKEKSLKSKVIKLDKIRRLRLNIQDHMGQIINELDYNRRYHHSIVIRYLMSLFNIEKTYERISKQFDVIYDSIENESLKHQIKQERHLEYLNILIVAGVLGQILTFFIEIFGEDLNASLRFLNLIGGIMLFVFLIVVAISILFIKFRRDKLVEQQKTRTVDAIIKIKDPKETEERYVIIKRKSTPYKDCYALPGCFIDKKEEQEEIIKTKVESETKLVITNLERLKKIFKHNKKSKITSEAYLCKVTKEYDLQKLTDIKTCSKEELEELNLSFHHIKILEEAGILEKK